MTNMFAGIPGLGEYTSTMVPERPKTLHLLQRKYAGYPQSPLGSVPLTSAVFIIYWALSGPHHSCFQACNYLHLHLIYLSCHLTASKSSGKQLSNPYPKMLNDPQELKKSYHRRYLYEAAICSQATTPQKQVQGPVYTLTVLHKCIHSSIELNVLRAPTSYQQNL